MKPVILDKIASVTLNCGLTREVRVSEDIPCREGDVIAVRVTGSKSTYNQLELTTGRFSTLKDGDVVAGALGHRKALCGYAGHVPESLQPGDRVDLLNLGGVLGRCDAINPDVGRPFSCEVLGQVLHFPYLGERVGVAAHIGQGLDPLATGLRCDVPVIAVVGTCMNSGKTLACSAIVQELTRRQRVVHGAKATGVSLRRDVLAMEDAGAEEALVFTDLGVVTTTPDNAPGVTRTLLSRLAANRPDVIVLELGDGLMGAYGVDAILAQEDIRKHLTAVVLAAGDPVGAWGGVRMLDERHGIRPAVVTGPATDNVCGSELIESACEIAAVNARTDPVGLVTHLLEAVDGAAAGGNGT